MRLVLAIIRYFDRQAKTVILGIAFGCLLGLSLVRGLAPHGAQYETAITLSYLVPVSFTAWHAGSRWGLVMSAFAAIIGIIAVVVGPTPSIDADHRFWLLYGNGLARLAAFLLVTLLVSALRLAQDRATDLARTDPLTGVGNRRWFREQLEREIHRCERYQRPFTLLYGDLDNFKTVNDRLGHATGDALLREVARSLQHEVRGSDIIARLGGDEFGILLSETDQAAGYAVVQQLQRGISEAMARRSWPVRASFGAVTCVDPPASVDAVLELADELMYAAKREGASGIRHAVLASTAGADEGSPMGTAVPLPP